MVETLHSELNKVEVSKVWPCLVECGLQIRSEFDVLHVPESKSADTEIWFSYILHDSVHGAKFSIINPFLHLNQYKTFLRGTRLLSEAKANIRIAIRPRNYDLSAVIMAEQTIVVLIGKNFILDCFLVAEVRWNRSLLGGISLSTVHITKRLRECDEISKMQRWKPILDSHDLQLSDITTFKTDRIMYCSVITAWTA